MAKRPKKRGRTAAERNDIEAYGVPLPRIVIRMVPVSQQVDGATADAPPMLYPNRATGRHLLSGVLESMTNLLGVYALVGLRALQADQRVRDPITEVQKACPRVLKYLLEIGRAQLASATGFDTEEQLVAWAARPTDAYRIPNAFGRQPTAFREAVLEPIRMATMAIRRVEWVSAAFDRTQLLPNHKVEAALAEAFTNGPSVSAWDCYGVARFADISPGPLWRVCAHHTDLFELGRFVGRVDRGAKALLVGPRLNAMAWTLAGDVEDADVGRMCAHVRGAVDAHFGVESFGNLVQRAMETGGVITVDRQTRNLRCRTDVGREARLLGR